MNSLTSTERKILKAFAKKWKYMVKADNAKPGSRRQARLHRKANSAADDYVGLFRDYFGTHDLRKTPIFFRVQRERIELHYLAKLK